MPSPSMGPPPFGDGKPLHATALSANYTSWQQPSPTNLQWGHRLSAMETQLDVGLPNGATAGFGDGNFAIASLGAFNGATAFGNRGTNAIPWLIHRKPSIAFRHGTHRDLAAGHHVIIPSMGPNEPAMLVSSTFNGATAFRRCMPGPMGPYLTGSARHRLARRPSMGPPPFGDGNVL